MTPFANRVVAAMGAGAFGQVINIVIQLVSLPVFLYKWDLATYGTWLMLSAMPAYLSMADAGMVSTAGNRMTMEVARGDVALANRIFQSAVAFMLLTCTCLAVLTLPVVMFALVPGVHTMDERCAVTALICGVLLALFGGVAEAIFRSTGRYALGTALGSMVRLAEWLGWIVGVLVWGTFSSVALCGLIARMAGVLFTIRLSRSQAQGFEWGVTKASMVEVKAMVKPALSFMLFPLSNAISFQGITLLVGQLFGPVLVALFNTYRTIARIAVQVTGTFGHALWAEFSRLFGGGGVAAVATIYRRSAWAGVLMSVVLSAVLYLLAPTLLNVWTHGAVSFEPTLMLALLIYAAVCGSWHVPRVLLMAINQHVGLAQWSVLSACLAFGMSYVLGKAWGVSGVGAGMLLAEAVMAAVCVFLAYRLVAAP
jgi:O-antigen/teichoic acid export membrane protein